MQISELNKQLEEEKRQQMESLHRHSAGEGGQSNKKVWTEAETQFLIKGVNVFPAGTKER